jgi:hypothetical protein
MSADTYANSQSTSTEHAISYIGVEATGDVFSRHPRLSQGAKHLVAVILRHLNRKDMKCFPGDALLVRETGLSSRWIRECRRDLVATGLLAHDGENYDFKFDRIRRIVGCVDAAEKLQKNYDSAVKAASARGRKPSSSLRRGINEAWSLVRRAYRNHDEDIEDRIKDVMSEFEEVENAKAIEKEVIASAARKAQERKAREQEAQKAQVSSEAPKTQGSLEPAPTRSTDVSRIIEAALHHGNADYIDAARRMNGASSSSPLWTEPFKGEEELYAFAKWLMTIGVTNVSSPANVRDAHALVDACNYPHGTPDARRIETAAMRHTRGAVYAMIYELSDKKGTYAVDSIENGLKRHEQTARNILDLRDRETEEAEIPSSEFILRSDGVTISVNAKKVELSPRRPSP